ncbi:hypothetical protein BATDEDRAFT_90476 [Batrachochytrium dendrobatidis JAM81]|uniref:DNA polymerase epsilon subunit D n=2 Tax=Batrachochytrium dendrobatidis TaxID=109871 RepID=F4P7V0_BATDJ|nr:uncharacterized protein BATDEDRAFT_90476 [Batrachochytrium dendrobatidis JAM81]EGF78726.1 hypothetical protein BATDEDRAFT_90476 [Batrachochytrium dendrobatidis JAM81]KAJ8323943.1 hypothetical protein O5D80_007166 [Batrachochytrium dendrobatidis]KAK5664746.1 hypothetical protein QVD99_008293 [Batrachochytrium dendrobatidis]OAJ43686.1 hypothetical protein BDEG_27020 [Batrachochytrium dendrobatidis JEL423]|eukprot:XP_006680953.1 hypothetical protein BATDEDRAFT_90476 [Batrachochytrium dendrobatidis JAM81]
MILTEPAAAPIEKDSNSHQSVINDDDSVDRYSSPVPEHNGVDDNDDEAAGGSERFNTPSVTAAALLGTAASSAGLSIEEYELPRSIVQRVIKRSTPANIKVHKDAKSALNRCCTVFINYLTATANDVTKKAGRKTVGVTDIYKALEVLELQEVLFDRIQSSVQAFQKQVKGRRLESKKRQQNKKQSDDAEADPEEETHTAEMEVDEVEDAIPQKRKTDLAENDGKKQKPTVDMEDDAGQSSAVEDDGSGLHSSDRDAS